MKCLWRSVAPVSASSAILSLTMIDAMGFVAAGGRSSRMGSDKAWLEIGGRPMIEHVIAALASVTTSLAIIANSPEYGRLGFPVFADTHKNIGPLEAIRAALSNAVSRRIVMVGCDLPFVSSDLFKFLLSVPGVDQVVVPIGPDGKLEPMCSIYWRETLPAITELIKRGERKISLLFERVPTRFVSFDEIRHLKGSESFFENVNTPADYVRALDRLQKT